MRKYKIVTSMKRTVMEDDWWDKGPLLPNLTVYEDDGNSQDTGLVDHLGRSIFSFVERGPMGFTNRLGSNE